MIPLRILPASRSTTTKLQEWLGKGAQPTTTVKSLISKAAVE